MSEEKQIDKMVCEKCLHYEGCLKRFMEAKQALGMYSSTTEEEYFAHADDCDMFITGYRKASEVAREIFEEIDKLAYRFMNDRHYIFGDMVYDLAELKNKYTEGEK